MECIFCRIVSGDVPSRLISESEHAVSILDAFPLARGHALVLSRRHCQKIQDLSPEENTDLFALVHRVTARIDEAMTGSTLLAVHNGREAGQEIPHLHVHIVPRRQGDSAGAIHGMFGPAARIPEPEMDRLHGMLRDPPGAA